MVLKSIQTWLKLWKSTIGGEKFNIQWENQWESKHLLVPWMCGNYSGRNWRYKKFHPQDTPTIIHLVTSNKYRKLYSRAKSHLFETNANTVLHGCETWKRKKKKHWFPPPHVHGSIHLGNVYMYSIKSPKCTWICMYSFISLYLLYMFWVLFTLIIRSTNCRAQPYICVMCGWQRL
jgi:hypothetical protein